MTTRLNTALFTFSIITTLQLGACSTTAQESKSRPISHASWTSLLQKHVSPDGRVNYQGFIGDKKEFDTYLASLSGNHPNDKNWSKDEQLAYWINAYNAFTVKLVVDNYPVESIKDIKKGLPMINSVWDIKFIEIEGEKYDLNNIEHSILRKEFDEPRIHFAINCASVSCPLLLNEAYTADKVEAQLEAQSRAFLSDPTRNKVSTDKLELSKIFTWFKGDFTKNGSLAEFIDRYTDTKVSPDAKIDFLPYDWNLND